MDESPLEGVVAVFRLVAEALDLDPQTLFFAFATAAWSVSRLMGTTVASGTHGLKYSFGRAVSVLEPGFHALLPGLQTVVHAPTRTRSLDLPPQRIRTADGLAFEVDANLTFRVTDLRASLVEVSDLDQALLDRLAVCVQQVLGVADRSAMTDLRGFDEELFRRLGGAVQVWGVTIEQVGLTSVRPAGPSVRVTQLRAVVEARLATLVGLQSAGVSRRTSLALMGTRTRYVSRTRRALAWERASRVSRREWWALHRGDARAQARSPVRIPRALVFAGTLVVTLSLLCAASCLGLGG